MKLPTPNSKLETRNSPPGSVIVLVVAVLALLAVIGTVYIVSARAERSAATSSNAAVNVGLARDAINTKVIDVIGGAAYDANGQLAGNSAAGLFGNKTARNWDIPEFGTIMPNTTNYNVNFPDQLWLATNLYLPTTPLTADPRYNDVSLLSLNGFNPSTGAFDLPYYTINAGNRTTTGLGTLRVVADPSMPPISNNASLPFGNGTSTVGDDAFVQLLPFSEANGVRYRFGVRILDTSRMANLNVGMTYNTSPSTWQLNGTYMDGYSLASPSIFNGADTRGNLNGASGPANPGRLGMWNPAAGTAPAEYIWLYANLRFDMPSFFGIQPPCPFDVSDELEFRSYGNLGTLSLPRPMMLWPGTLTNRNTPTTVAVNMNRSFYTAYSWSRDLRPYNDTVDNPVTSQAYELLPPGGAWFLNPPSVPNPTFWPVWPASPARVAANPDISSYVPTANIQQASDPLVIAAVNIATAMKQIAGYGDDDARFFAANYLTSRWSSWAPVGASNSYRLVHGPSFIDVGGPCLRTDAGNVDYLSGLNSGDPKRLYLGYAAQPFINEIAAHYTFVPDVVTPPGKWVEDDGAIELYNPYDVALALDDFQIVVNGVTIDLSGQYVPARGYYVVTEPGGTKFASAVAAAATKSTAAFTLRNGTKMYLMRKYARRGSATLSDWAAVDQYDITAANGAALDLGGANSPETDSVARPNSNVPDGAAGTPTQYAHWTAVIHDPAQAEIKQTAPPTLGAANPAGATLPLAYLPLWDRTLDLFAYPPADLLSPPYNYNRQIPFNIADFNRIMRLGTAIDPTDATLPGVPLVAGPISAQLPSLITSAPADSNVGKTMLPAEAMLHFDFLAAPNLYSNPSGSTPPVVGDTRAWKLLDCLTFTDRVSDYSINLGDNDPAARGISKIRIPGQINVNTAPPEVLATIPILAQNPKVIGLILAYRWRCRTDDMRIAAIPFRWGALVDFSTAPGYGIRSLAELQIALLPALTSPMTLYDRDRLWASIYNSLTVRSDTFVVYAYLEAVRQNPRYRSPPSPAFNNSTIWYTTAGITDDPTDSAHPLQRVARRRWVSIIDRSQSNYNRTLPLFPGPGYTLDSRFTQPRIVAQKDLPN